MGWAIFVAGCVFAGLAGICAYLVTLDEMLHHFPSRWRAHAEALHRAAVIAGLFVVCSGVLALVLPRFVTH
ncbi:MAG TPA: hypothetical protein VE673_04450 [Pseudonocardiaceae bacterium]|nr:hypothetical protein [Pseudonocardiaceae bacterium]